MSVRELIVEIEKLSVKERLELVEAVRQGIQTMRPVDRVYGILATDQPAPTDEEVKQMYIDYLEEKYK